MRKLLMSALWMAVVGCAPVAGGPSVGQSTGTGQLTVSVQATSGGSNVVSGLEQIVVSVAAVTAHAAGGGWVTVSETPAVVDLLRLQDSAEELGFADLPAGKITQIRLYVADDDLSHAVDKAGVTSPLTIPSGLQSGIKLKGPFELGECELGTAIAVLDLDKSIRIHGRGNQEDLILRPTIHRTDYSVVTDDGCVPGGVGDDVPGDDVPGDDVPGDDVPGDDVPGDDVPGDDVPGDDVPADDDAEDECAPVLTESGLVSPCG